MEQVSKKQKKNVQPAETRRPDTDDKTAQESAVAVAAPQPKAETTVAPKSVSIVDLAKAIDPQKLALAEQMGIPLKPILKWAYTIENSVIAQGQALEQLGVKLQPLITLAERAQQAQQQQYGTTQQNTTQQPQPPAGPLGALGPILQMLPQFLGQGGGSAISDKIVNTVMENALSSMTLSMDFQRMINQKMAQDLAATIVPKVIPKA